MIAQSESFTSSSKKETNPKTNKFILGFTFFSISKVFRVFLPRPQTTTMEKSTFLAINSEIILKVPGKPSPPPAIKTTLLSCGIPYFSLKATTSSLVVLVKNFLFIKNGITSTSSGL